LLDALRDRQRHLASLAVADAHDAVAVTHDHEGREAEATTALDDLRHAVDRDDALQELTLVAIASAAVAVGVALATASAGLAGLALGGSLGRSLSGSLLGHVVLLVLTHRFSPPSRAPSAIAATRPA